MGIPLKQKKFIVDEALDAEGAFVVGTAAEVTGVNSLNDHVFPKPWFETIGYALQKEYEAATRKEEIWEEMIW